MNASELVMRELSISEVTQVSGGLTIQGGPVSPEPEIPPLHAIKPSGTPIIGPVVPPNFTGPTIFTR